MTLLGSTLGEPRRTSPSPSTNTGANSGNSGHSGRNNQSSQARLAAALHRLQKSNHRRRAALAARPSPNSPPRTPPPPLGGAVGRYRASHWYGADEDEEDEEDEEEDEDEEEGVEGRIKHTIFALCGGDWHATTHATSAEEDGVNGDRPLNNDAAAAGMGGGSAFWAHMARRRLPRASTDKVGQATYK
jgi:hypothetical protein